MNHPKGSFYNTVDEINNCITLILIISLLLVSWYHLFRLGKTREQAKQEYYRQYAVDKNL